MIPKVALVGIGGYANVHYQYLKKLLLAGKVEFAGVVIRPGSMAKYADAVKELEELDIPVFPDDDALLATCGDELDLICLPVGIEAHCTMCCKFLRAGINVLLEKPAAGCVADVLEMINVRRETGKFVAIGFHDMYGRDFHAIKRLILSGKYGKLKEYRFCGCWPRSDAYYNRNNWAGKLRAANGGAIYDSPINNAFAHYLNIGLFVAGETFEVTAKPVAMQAELVSARDTIETFDTCGVRLITDTDVNILLLMTHACMENRHPLITFVLENGQIEWDFDKKRYQIQTLAGEVLEEFEVGDCRESLFDDVIARIEDESRFVYTLENALEHTRCIEFLHNNFNVKRLQGNELIIHDEKDNQREIPGISDLFEKARLQGKLPAEAGAAWSPSADMIRF